MLYGLVKIGIRIALPFYARRIEIFNKAALEAKGPLMLAVNHPNSFLDAILVGAFMKHPVHFITRGDVFKRPIVRKMLGILNMIPIFRIRDGKEKLSLNEETFLKSVEVLRHNGILLIFVEGFCENQTSLQLPLKKGAPRILQSCWQQNIDAKVLPIWVEYSSFDRIGKTVHIRMGEVFGREVAGEVETTVCIPKINAETADQLMHLHYSHTLQHQSPGILTRLILLIPAMLGAVIHAPYYLLTQSICRHQTSDNPHYDSVLIAVLFVTYPIVLLVVAAIIFSYTGQWWTWPMVLLGLPALALCYIRWKK